MMGNSVDRASVKVAFATIRFDFFLVSRTMEKDAHHRYFYYYVVVVVVLLLISIHFYNLSSWYILSPAYE